MAALLLAGLALTPVTAGAAAMFTGLGFLPSTTASVAAHVSADGSTAVGESLVPGSGPGKAFRWTAAGGLLEVPPLPTCCGGNANGVSGDGSAVVGASGGQAFRWSAASGTVGLGILPGETYSTAIGVSADGATVVGYSDSGDRLAGTYHQEAFRWTAGGGMVGLGFLTGGTDSIAFGVSADASTIVGYSTNASGSNEAFRWTTGTGMVGLGFLTGGTTSMAFDISADGSTIVGTSDDGATLEAFRWTSGSGMVGLGFLSGWSRSRALAVSSDGSTAVGYADNGAVASEAFIWDATHGMRSLAQVLTAQGADLAGWTLDAAGGISDDGRTIVGYGTNPSGQREAWRAVLPEPGTDALLLMGMLGLAVPRRRRGPAA